MSHTQGHKSLREVKSHDRKYQPPFFIKQPPIRFSSEHATGISHKYEYNRNMSLFKHLVLWSGPSLDCVDLWTSYMTVVCRSDSWL